MASHPEGAPVTVAMAGLGAAGRSLHLPALAGLHQARVVGVCDPHAPPRGHSGFKPPAPVFADLDTMLEATRPQVVILATPPDLHRDQCLTCLAAGAHVICEKPFVNDLEAADEVIAAARSASRQVALNHEFREMPIFRVLREQIAGAVHGQLRLLQIWQHVLLPPWDEAGWRGQLHRRTLFEAGVHLVDLAMTFFGERPLRVSATMSGLGRDVADVLVLVTLEFSDGRLASIVQNRLTRGTAGYLEVRADTERASLRASFGGRARVSAGLLRSSRPHARFEYGASGIAWAEQGPNRRILARNPANPTMRATREVIRASLQAFVTGAVPPTSAERARTGIEVILAAYQSAETGRAVTLPTIP